MTVVRASSRTGSSTSRVSPAATSTSTRPSPPAYGSRSGRRNAVL